MPHVTQCPEPRELLRFTLGLLSEAEFEPLAEHVRTCSRCATTLNNLRAADTLIDALRSNHDTVPVLAPAVEALMDRLAAAPPAPHHTIAYPSADDPVPEHFGRFRILAPLGAGGMGTVYRAHDAQLRRDVAIKVPRFQGAKQTAHAAAQRFLREARAAAAVRHPHVCPIYDVGEHDGQPFVVMALIEGRSLDARLKDGPFADPREAVALAAQVAAALTAVHDAGIIHRDLKPANILLDHHGQPLLTDFGLAREQRDQEHLTAEGALIGTPAFMAPEQVTPEHGPVGPWTDQYSLAVVLYRMLAGRLPFEGSAMSLIHQIATQAPPPPSRYRPDLDPGLERVLMRALARKPRDRYPDVARFRDALLAWHEPPAIGTAAPATRTAARPEPEETVAFPEPRPRRPRPWWRAAAAGLVLAVVGLCANQIIIRYKDGAGKDKEIPLPPDATQPEIEYPKYRPLPAGAPLSPFALVGRPAKIQGVESWSIETVGHRGAITAVAYADDGKQLASAGVDGAIRIWDDTGTLVRLIVRREEKEGRGVPAPTALAWSPDAKTIACADGSGDVAVVDSLTGKCQFVRTGGNPVNALAWSPDGELLAGLDTDAQRVYVTKVKSREEALPTAKTEATGLIFAPNGQYLILGGKKELQLLNLTSGKMSRALEEQGAGAYGPCLAWSPDRKTLLAGRRLWQFEAQTSRALEALDTDGSSAAWSPDGQKVYQAIQGHAIEWDSKSGKKLGARGMGAAANDKLTLAPNAATCTAWYVYGSYLKCADTATGKSRFEVPGQGLMHSAFSPDRKTLATAHADYTLRLWDVATGGRRLNREDVLPGSPSPLRLVWSANGKELLYDRILDATDLKPVPSTHPLASIKRSYESTDAQWLSDGKKMALVRRPHTVAIWDTQSGKEVQHFQFDMASLDAFSWSSDGTRIVVPAGTNGALMVRLDSPQEKPIRVGEGDTPAHANCVGFAPDGKMVAVGGNKLQLCDGSTGKHLHTLVTGGPVYHFAFSPDGKRIAAFADNSLQTWDVESRKPLKRCLRPGVGNVWRSGDITWMPDGKTVALTDRAALVVFYDAETLAPSQTIVGMGNGQGLAVNAEGHYRGTPAIGAEIVYVIQTDKGQETLTPAEFDKRFGWKNDPDRVHLPVK